jgi:hypothetical protein
MTFEHLTATRALADITLEEGGSHWLVVVRRKDDTTGAHEFRAELPVCRGARDGHWLGREPCSCGGSRRWGKRTTSVKAELAHGDQHCHCWHLPAVREFVRAVLKTYSAERVA